MNFDLYVYLEDYDDCVRELSRIMVGFLDFAAFGYIAS